MVASPSYLFYLWSKFRSNFDMAFGRLYPSLHPTPRDLTGKTAIVTGANVGIGLEAARSLAIMGATVVLVCRNEKKAQTARLDIIENSAGKVGPEKVEVKILDFGDLQSVRAFVDDWGTRPLDILVNNAGMTTSLFKRSPQGFEMTYATNMLSHYLLSLSLLPNFRDGGRIVNVSSGANYGVKKQFDINDLDYSKALEGKHHLEEGNTLPAEVTMELYFRSKLLQVYFTRELQERLDESEAYRSKDITVHAYHPGVVKSSIWGRESGLDTSWKDYILAAVDFLGVSPEQGAATAVHLATSDEARLNKGLYWDRMGQRAPNRLVEDAEARGLVWNQMAEECGLPSKLRL